MATYSSFLTRKICQDRGAWQTEGHGVAKSHTWQSMHESSLLILITTWILCDILIALMTPSAIHILFFMWIYTFSHQWMDDASIPWFWLDLWFVWIKTLSNDMQNETIKGDTCLHLCSYIFVSVIRTCPSWSAGRWRRHDPVTCVAQAVVFQTCQIPAKTRMPRQAQP